MPLGFRIAMLLGFRIFGAVGVDVVIVAGEASRHPARPQSPPAASRSCVVSRGGARRSRPGQPRPPVRTAPSSPASPSSLPSPLVTGRKRMDVAPYGFYCVGCHIHGLIRADARQIERGSGTRTPARTPHSRGRFGLYRTIRAIVIASKREIAMDQSERLPREVSGSG